MKKLIALLLLASLFTLSGCTVLNPQIKTDRDRVASAALTYESVLDGLITARESGLLDDDAYRKIDPAVDTANKLLLSLKERVDAGEGVSPEALNRADILLDLLLDVLIQYAAPQSKIDAVNDMKLQLSSIMKTHTMNTGA